MPEFPEVYTIIQDLKKYLTGATITDVQTIAGYSIKGEVENPQKALEGLEILNVVQAGKQIVFELKSVDLVFHLAMTGKLLIRSIGFKADPHTRIVFTLLKNGKTLELRFIDVRMFGKAQLQDKNATKKLINSLGPSPLDENLSDKYFYTILRSKKTTIKNVLLDQNKLAGLGNVYATDALWIAKIHPTRLTQSITMEDATNLLAACREILAEGIKNRGLTISDYVDALGKPGNQQNFFRVYRQETCKRCSSNIQTITMNTRTTYFCPTCQI